MALAATAAVPSVARAQVCSTGCTQQSMTATYTVSTGVAVGIVRSLQAAMFAGGGPVTVPYSSATTGGAFQVTGGKKYSFRFTSLPTVIETDGDPAHRITVSYANQVCYGTALAGCTLIANPTQGTTVNFNPPGGSNVLFYVFIGGQFTAPAGTPSGAYPLTITLRAALEGF